MNNEPVAWLWIHKGVVMNALLLNPDCDEINKEYWSKRGWHSEPLYTHLAKTLTDEEIKQIFQEQTGFHFDDNPADDLALMDFARAIIRKAQEK